jgi:hypothetical protein
LGHARAYAYACAYAYSDKYVMLSMKREDINRVDKAAVVLLYRLGADLEVMMCNMKWRYHRDNAIRQLNP